MVVFSLGIDRHHLIAARIRGDDGAIVSYDAGADALEEIVGQLSPVLPQEIRIESVARGRGLNRDDADSRAIRDLDRRERRGRGIRTARGNAHG